MRKLVGLEILCAATLAGKANAAEYSPEARVENVPCITLDTLQEALWLWPPEVQELFDVRFTEIGVIEERTTFVMLDDSLMDGAVGMHVPWFNQIWIADMLPEAVECDPDITAHHEIAHRAQEWLFQEELCPALTDIEFEETLVAQVLESSELRALLNQSAAWQNGLYEYMMSYSELFARTMVALVTRYGWTDDLERIPPSSAFLGVLEKCEIGGTLIFGELIERYRSEGFICQLEEKTAGYQ